MSQMPEDFFWYKQSDASEIKIFFDYKWSSDSLTVIISRSCRQLGLVSTKYFFLLSTRPSWMCSVSP